MTFDDDQRLHLKVDDLTWREVHDELLVLDMTTGTYLTLNGSARYLWEELADGATVGDLGATLVKRYGISRERAATDAREFVKLLEERSFLDAER